MTYPATVQDRDLTVAGILTGSSGVVRQHSAVTRVKESGPGDLVESSFTLPFGEFREVRLHLLLRGHNVDSVRAAIPAPGSPNPRFQSLFGLGRIGDVLAEVLSQPEAAKNAERLELAICWLLHLCGFQVMPTDLPKLTGSDVADVVAYDPYSANGLVIEVTAKDPLSGEKLSKLRRRTDALASSASSVTFYPVAIAPSRESFLEIEIEAAQRLSITLRKHSGFWSA